MKVSIYEAASELAVSACAMAAEASKEAVSAISEMKNAEHPLELMLAYERLKCAAAVISADGDIGRQAAIELEEEAADVIRRKYAKRDVYTTMEHNRFMRETAVKLPMAECLYHWSVNGIPENAAFEFIADCTAFEYDKI